MFCKCHVDWGRRWWHNMTLVFSFKIWVITYWNTVVKRLIHMVFFLLLSGYSVRRLEFLLWYVTFSSLPLLSERHDAQTTLIYSAKPSADKPSVVAFEPLLSGAVALGSLCPKQHARSQIWCGFLKRSIIIVSLVYAILSWSTVIVFLVCASGSLPGSTEP